MIFRRLLTAAREHLKARSPKWGHVRKLHLAVHPTCAACGTAKSPQVHHLVPFALGVNLGRPDLELDLSNLLTLCNTKHECHFFIGHGGSFHDYNPHAKEDAAEAWTNPGMRKRVQMKAHNLRKPIP